MAQQYLRILRRLLDLRRRHIETLNEQGLDLIGRAIAAAFRECVDAGAAAEASRLLEGGTS